MFFLQQADYLRGLATPLWDASSSRLLGDDSILGRLLHTLVGYTATPDAAQVLAYGLVIALMLATMRLVRGRSAAARRERVHRPDCRRPSLRPAGGSQARVRPAVLRLARTPLTMAMAMARGVLGFA